MFRKCFLFVLIAWASLTASSQSVGLVLSGGGSKGLAHIGVIKALEEQRIPIDYIGGTSMGAIVGGCYAMGMSTDEMIAIIKSKEFAYWMSGVIEEKYKYYFKEEDPAPDLITVGIDLKDSVNKTRIPISVIPSHLMDYAFMEIFSRASAAAGYDFDSLFVPFLCNAVDVSNNKEIVFRKGDLSQAIRASMTVPLYFRPIVMDGNILYDGGIYDNFPLTHVISEFQPDVLIGSKAAMGNTAPDEFDILGQIENIVMKPASYNIDSGQGVLLDHDLKKQSLLAFDKLDEFVEVGYQTTLGKMDSIKLLVQRVADDTLTLKQKRKEFVDSFPELRFNDFEMEGLSEKQEYYVERSIRKADSILDVDEMKTEYLKLASDKSFAYIYPRAVYKANDSLFTMKLRVVPQTPMEARFGLFFSTTGMAQTYLGFNYRQISEISTYLKGNIQFGRYYNGVNLGVRFDYPSNVPVFFKMDFNYNGYRYNSYNINSFFFKDLKPPYITEDEINIRLDLGIPYKINGVIKGGLGIGRNREIYYMTREFASTDTSEVSNINLFSAYVASDRNTLNNKQFPTEGTKRIHSLRVGYGMEYYYPGSTAETSLNERQNYTWLSAKVQNIGYVPLGESFVLGYHLQAEATFKPMLSNYYSTIIEATAFQPNIITKGLFMEHYRANQFIALGLMPAIKIRKQIHAKLEAYAFFPVQEILRDPYNQAYLGTYFDSMQSLFSASLNVVTVAGPISLNVGYLTQEENPFVLQLSFGYLLFNKNSADE